MSGTKREREEMSKFLNEIDFESPPQAKKTKKRVEIDNIVRTRSNPDGNNVMTVEEQERIVEEHDRPLIEQGINPKNTFRQYNGKNQTAHGPSTTESRVIEGNNNDPLGLWTKPDEKKNAIKDQKSSKNFVENNKKNYEWIKELISTNQITPDYPMKIDGKPATAKDFIDRYENHIISAAEKKEGGKKNKKNRKTKRKSKRKNKRKTLSKKSKRKSKRKTSNKKSKH